MGTPANDDLISRAGRIGCAPIVDALGARHSHRSHLHDLVAPAPGHSLTGPVMTMRFLPLRHDLVEPGRHDFGALLDAAAESRALDGLVLVCAADDSEQAVAGGKKLARLQSLGLGGLVTDGRVRDFAEASEMGLAVWCRGEAVRNANDALMAWETDVPVSLAGTAVAPGDWIHADAAGAVVIPGDEVAGVLAEAAAIVERDAAQGERLRAADVERTRRR
jgi:4-hydroxy-4-methyl-2-oxoglutarate aldolase